uniref:Uncharacterized protein n=1 Tax=Anopheles minimus TaxID=112268 RepID=A0A3F2Z0Y5_9DIPT
MDRKNVTKLSSTGSTRRKSSFKSIAPSEPKEIQPERNGGKVERGNTSSGIPLQQNGPHYAANFASVHRPRQLSSIAAIKRTAGSNAVAQDGRDTSTVVFGADPDSQQPGPHQKRHSKYGPSKAVAMPQRPEAHGNNGPIGRSNAKVAPAYTDLPAGRILHPAGSGVGGENNGRIFNQPTLPLPVQIPNPYAYTSSPAVASVTGPNYGAQQLQHRPAHQLPVAQKTDYLQPSSGGIRQGVNQKSSSSTAFPAGWVGDGCRRFAAQPAGRFTKQQSTSAPTPTGLAGGRLTSKLLNDIYEKHLLSQTTFEVSTNGLLTSTSTPAKAPNNPPGKHNSTEMTRTLTKSDTRLRATSKATGKEGTSVTLYDASLRPAQTDEHNLYESVRSNYHIYEKIDSRRSSLGGTTTPPVTSCASSAASSLEQYERPVAPHLAPPPLHPRPKSHPSAEPESNSATTPSSTVRQINLNELQKSIQFKLASNSSGGSSVLSPIQERPPLPPTTGGRTLALPQRSSSTRSERVNIALETAKAIATAAYIER